MKNKFKIALIINGLIIINNANSLDVNKNLFRNSCNLIDGKFKECNFSNINLFPYSKIHSEEFLFTVNYDLKNCNFNELNLQFNTNKDFFSINRGNKSINLEGYTLKIKDTYVWDTKTNEYDNQCSLVINSIETKFSKYTKEKLNSYFKIIDENKKFINELDKISNLIESLKLHIFALNIDKFESNFNEFLNLISISKRTKEKILFYPIVNIFLILPKQ